MTITFNLDTGSISPDQISLTVRDRVRVRVRFVSGGEGVELPDNSTGKFGLKLNSSDEQFVAFSAIWTRVGRGRKASYLFDLSLNTTELVDLFTSNPSVNSLACIGEIQVESSQIRRSSQPFNVTVFRDVITGNEGIPSSATEVRATQEEAEAGVDNYKLMTPLRTNQAVSAYLSTPSNLTPLDERYLLKSDWNQRQLLGDWTVSGRLGISNGTVDTPSLHFNSEPETGLFSPTGSTLAVSAGGVERFRFGEVNSSTTPLLIPNGSSSFPSLGFNNSANTGLFSTAGGLGISVGGTLVFEISSSGAIYAPAASSSTADSIANIGTLDLRYSIPSILSDFVTTRSVPSEVHGSFSDPPIEPTSVSASGTTVTVTLPNHGLQTGQVILVHTNPDSAYRGIFRITVIDSDTFSYTADTAPPSTWNNTFIFHKPMVRLFQGNPGSVLEGVLILYVQRAGARYVGRFVVSSASYTGWCRCATISSVGYYWPVFFRTCEHHGLRTLDVLIHPHTAPCNISAIFIPNGGGAWSPLYQHNPVEPTTGEIKYFPVDYPISQSVVNLTFPDIGPGAVVWGWSGAIGIGNWWFGGLMKISGTALVTPVFSLPPGVRMVETQYNGAVGVAITNTTSSTIPSFSHPFSVTNFKRFIPF